MEWHQPWLLQLQLAELEVLHDDCRERAKHHLHLSHFGLCSAWNGLAHEVLERALELEPQSELRHQQQCLDLSLEGAYSQE